MWAHPVPTLLLLLLPPPAAGSDMIACVVKLTGGDGANDPVSSGRTCESPTNHIGDCVCCGVNASISSPPCNYSSSWKICGCGECPVSKAFRSTDSVKASTGISLFCCALVLVVMASSNKFRRHPNNYIFTKCVADIIFAAMFLHHQVQQDSLKLQSTQSWTSPTASPPLPSYNDVLKYHKSHIETTPNLLTGKFFHGCSPLSAGLTQFGMIVSVLTFGLIPIDSYVAMNYPFGNMEAFARKYQLIIIMISVLSALLLTYGKAYGAGYGLCWVCTQNAEKGEGFKVNLWRLFLMYLPIVGTMISNVVFMSVIYNRLLGCNCISWLCTSPQVRAAGADSETLRKDVFKSGFTYTVLFTVYWVAVLIPYVICMFLEAYGENGEVAHYELYSSSANAFVVLLGLQGVVDAVVFTVVNWKYLIQGRVLCWLCRPHRVTSVLMEDEEDIAARQYVKALRSEVFEYVAQGVRWSVDRTRARMLGTQSQRGREENNTLQLKKAHVDVPGITSVLRRTNAGTEIEVPTSAFVQSGEAIGSEISVPRWQTHSGAAGTSRGGSAPGGSARGLVVGSPPHPALQNQHKAYNGSRLQFTSHGMEQDESDLRVSSGNRNSTRGYPMFRRGPSSTSSGQASSNDLSEPLLTSTSGDDNSNDFEESIRFKTQQRRPQRKGLADARKAEPSPPSAQIRLHSDPRNSDIEFQVEANVSHTSSSGETTQFRFVDHQPKMFWQLREQLGIDHDEFVRSVTAHASEKFSEGASGAFMYYSQDNQYIVKTHEWEEMMTLMEVLEDYLAHFRAHKNSLLNQYLGAYSIQLYSQMIHFIIMRNCFADAGSRLEIYDLKGSYVNRNGKRTAQLRGERKHCKRCNQVFIVGDTKAVCPEALNQQTHVPRVVLKDNDLNFRVNLNSEQRREMARQIRCDVKFLEKKGLMDYSLLLGVKKRQVKVQPRSDRDSSTLTSTGGTRSRRQSIMQGKFSGQLEAEMVEGPGVYYVGIVDILQRWTFAKKAERFAKVVFKCLWQQRDGLSAIPPRFYRKRFDHRVVRALLKAPDADDAQFRSGSTWSDDDDSVGSSLLQIPPSSDHSVQ